MDASSYVPLARLSTCKTINASALLAPTGLAVSVSTAPSAECTTLPPKSASVLLELAGMATPVSRLILA